jgi:hypothetical protein
VARNSVGCCYVQVNYLAFWSPALAKGKPVTNDVPSCEQNWLAMVDTSTVNIARVWHYWLGGKDNYPIDEQVGDQIAAAIPQTIDFASAVRGF